MSRLTAVISLLLIRDGRAGFQPFADVEELKPTRLEPYCEQTITEDGYRWCARSIKKTLEDDGEVEMHWRMHVNPKNILSLDTEAEHGVKVTRCAPGELELTVPDSHVQHMAAGKFIVGSHFVHGCHHLTDKHMYHRVMQVLARHKPTEQRQGGLSRFHVATETLPGIQHLARHISINFSYMPLEARQTHLRFPPLRTDLGSKQKDRKLQGIFGNFLGGGQASNTQNFQSGGSASGGIDTQNSVLNLSPKQISNFGWNWDFSMNNSETPSFVIDKPGTKGSFIIRNPYVKAHGGCFLNFTSQYTGLAKAPHVQWQAGIKGHIINMQGRLEAAMNSTHSAELDPETYSLPPSLLEQLPMLRLLAKFDQPQWFSPIQKSAGNMPMTITPGFQFQMSLYHKGPFSGFLAFGGSTHGTLEPVMHFDSDLGFKHTFNGELLDTDMWPPMWMVFTEAFEMGLRSEPTFLLKGDFMGFNDAEAAIKMAVYNNVTVYRDGAVNFSADEQKELVVYPVRVMGISTLDMNTQYIVNISVDGNKSVLSPPSINWGEIEYHAKTSTFNLGSFTDTEVENLPITVTLLQETSGVTTELGSGTFTCESFETPGVCSPHPAYVNVLNTAGTEVAVVMLEIVHMERPIDFFVSRLKGVGVTFPSLDINMASLKTDFPNVTGTPMLHLEQGNRTYLANLAGELTGTSPTLTGTTSIELYPAFLQTWAPCTGFSLCNTPQVKLYIGSTLVGAGSIPQFGKIEQQSTGLLGKVIGVKTTTVAPVAAEVNDKLPTVTLYAPSGTVAVGMLTMNVRLNNPVESSMFMTPASGAQIALASSAEFMWTVAHANVTETYTFTLTPVKLTSASALNGVDTTVYRQIDDKFLVPIAGATQAVTANCQQRSLNGVPATAMPCSFVKELAFNGPTFAAGDQMLIILTWVVNGITSKIYSPPFAITAAAAQAAAAVPAATAPAAASQAAALPAATSRRLSLSPGAERMLQAATPTAAPPVSVPNSQFSMSQNIDDNDPSCAKKDLHFNFGQGMEMRGEILSVGVPKDFPAFPQDPSSGPMYATPWQTMGGAQPGMEADNFMPKQFCEAGMCSTMLPGCRQAQFKKMHFPKLLFNFSRNYFYSNTTGTVMKNGMAWAFSAMPEAVTVLLTKMEEKQKELQQQNAVPDFGFGNYGNTPGTSSTNNWFSGSSSQTSAQSTQSSGGLSSFFGIKRRRLSEKGVNRMMIDQDGKMVHVPSQLESHQVAVQFRDGLPYIVDHHLLNVMKKSGFFTFDDDGLSKEKGELKITGFYVDPGHTISIPVQEGEVDSQGNESITKGLTAGIAGFALLAVTGLVASVIRRSKHASGYEWQVQSNAEAPLQAME